MKLTIHHKFRASVAMRSLKNLGKRGSNGTAAQKPESIYVQTLKST